MSEVTVYTFEDVIQEIEAEYKLMESFTENSRSKVVIHNQHGMPVNKIEFLKTVGLKNSLPVRMMSSLSSDSVSSTYEDIKKSYTIPPRFITEPQLERICEKYDLYVRDLEFYRGDIPEANIKEIIDFKVSPNIITGGLITRNITNPNGMIPLDRLMNVMSDANIITNRFLCIASVKELFLSTAFKLANGGDNRVPFVRLEEQPPTGKVMKDPIVMVRCFREEWNSERTAKNVIISGYLVCTAWGAEANDLLLANPIAN